MKLTRQILALLATVLLLSVAENSYAQTQKIYIDGQPATMEELKKIDSKRIVSIKNSVENAAMVIRVELRKEGENAPEPTPEMKAAADSTAKAASEERVSKVLQAVYEQTTLLKEGASAADFTALKYDGSEVKLSDLRGKVVLLNFWATWCAPCLHELSPTQLPALVLEKFRDNPDFVFLPIAYTDDRVKLDAFFATENGQTIYAYLKACTAMDADKSIFGKYATKSVPRSFVIDREGRIVLGSIGAMPAEMQRIATAIATALDAK